MRRPGVCQPWTVALRLRRRTQRSLSTSPPIIQIENATFYRDYPSTTASAVAPGGIHSSPAAENPPLYAGLTFRLESDRPQHWAVVGSDDKSKFLNILRGQYICVPPTARSYPHLATDKIAASNPRLSSPSHAIRYVGFNGESTKAAAGGIRGAYLSARYESRREETDFTVLQYLKGQTSLNPLETNRPAYSEDLLRRVVSDLQLGKLVDMPVANLSNGQGRRARIAKALLDEPEILLLDEPFMGLDPPTVRSLSPLLHNLAVKGAPRLVLSLRPQDPIPDWITHFVVLGSHNAVALQGDRSDVFRSLDIWNDVARRQTNSAVDATTTPASQEVILRPRSWEEEESYRSLSTEDRMTYDAAERLQQTGQFEAQATIVRDFGATAKREDYVPPRPTTYGEPIVEMEGVQVKYNDKTVLGGWRQSDNDGRDQEGLFWRVSRGQRWGIFGLNGSGKTTLISLVTSDHPQAYAQPLKLFGSSRLPRPGKPAISLFDLQSRIGHSSPEVHAFFPRNLSVRASLESAWADTFITKPRLNNDRNLDVHAALRFFKTDLKPDSAPHFSLLAPEPEESTDWADGISFASLPLPAQKVVLFIRAVIHRPDLVVLDEAFSGMPATLRDKCLHFLEVGETRRPSTGSHRTRDFASTWHLPREPASHNYARHTGLRDRQALIVVSHVKDEVPDVVSHWMRLPNAAATGVEDGGSAGITQDGLGPRTGVLRGRETVSQHAWDEIWRD